MSVLSKAQIKHSSFLILWSFMSQKHEFITFSRHKNVIPETIYHSNIFIKTNSHFPCNSLRHCNTMNI